VDVTSADVLDDLDKTLREASIDLCFAEMKDPVKDKLKRFGLFSSLGEHRFFATLGEAVSRYLEAEAVTWVDWEDRIVGGAPDRAQDVSAAGPSATPLQTR
jgi:hypothetical protein